MSPGLQVTIPDPRPRTSSASTACQGHFLGQLKEYGLIVCPIPSYAGFPQPGFGATPGAGAAPGYGTTAWHHGGAIGLRANPHRPSSVSL
jgi:hypothetical protein